MTEGEMTDDEEHDASSSSSSESSSPRPATTTTSYPRINIPFPHFSSLPLDPSLPSIHILNDDCLYTVLCCLDIVDMLRTALVCKRWYNVCLDRMSRLQHIALTPTFSVFRLYRALTSESFTSLLILSNSNLTHLDVSHSSLKLDLKCCQAIGNLCPSLVKLDLSKTKIDRKTASHLAKNIPPKLTSLVMNGCPSLKEKTLKRILMNCKNLEYLDVSYNHKINGKCIAKHLQQNRMRHFNFSECLNLDRSTLQFVLDNYSATLQHLDLSFSRGGISSTCPISTLTLPRMSTFNARCCDIKITVIRSVLKLMPNLQDLDLYKTSIANTSPVEEFILSISRLCPLLKSLNVGHCVKDSGTYLARTITELPYLENLNIDGLPESFDYDNLIKTALIYCKHLSSLSMQSCHVDDDHVTTIISEMHSLMSLDLRSCSSLRLRGDFIEQCRIIAGRSGKLVVFLQDTLLQKEDHPDIPAFLDLKFGLHSFSFSDMADSDDEFYDPFLEHEFDELNDEFDDEAEFWDGGYNIDEGYGEIVFHYYDVGADELGERIDALEIFDEGEGEDDAGVYEIDAVDEIDVFEVQHEENGLIEVDDIPYNDNDHENDEIGLVFAGEEGGGEYYNDEHQEEHDYHQYWDEEESDEIW